MGPIGPSRLCGPMLPVLIPPPRTQPSSYTSRMSPRQAYYFYHTTQYGVHIQPARQLPASASKQHRHTGGLHTDNKLPGSLGATA